MTRLFRYGDELTIGRVREILHSSDDPERITRLMIVELEGALSAARAAASVQLADRHAWRRDIAEARFREESWAEKAEVALTRGREDLARAALSEKQKAQADSVALASQVTLLEEIIRQSEEEIARIQSLLRDLKA